jgi:hypothetical protein
MNIIETFKTLGGFANHKPASVEEIAAAEQQLRLTFSVEYREYLLDFGQADGNGSEFMGITDVSYLDVVSETKALRGLNPQVSADLYAVENTNIDGIIIWQDSSGGIYKTAPGTAPRKIFDSFAEYLKASID